MFWIAIFFFIALLILDRNVESNHKKTQNELYEINETLRSNRTQKGWDEAGNPIYFD